MSSALAIGAIFYGVYALSGFSSKATAKQVQNLHADIRADIERGGLWGFVCRVVQPFVWLIALPQESVGAALGLAMALLALSAII